MKVAKLALLPAPLPTTGQAYAKAAPSKDPLGREGVSGTPSLLHATHACAELG